MRPILQAHDYVCTFVSMVCNKSSSVLLAHCVSCSNLGDSSRPQTFHIMRVSHVLQLLWHETSRCHCVMSCLFAGILSPSLFICLIQSCPACTQASHGTVSSTGGSFPRGLRCAWALLNVSGATLWAAPLSNAALMFHECMANFSCSTPAFCFGADPLGHPLTDHSHPGASEGGP